MPIKLHWLSFSNFLIIFINLQICISKILTTDSPNSDIHCLQPEVPENCHVMFAQSGPYSLGTVAKYNCALGYERIGSETRSCKSNGTWSGKPPICAIDVAQNKPAEQSSGQSTAQNAVLSIPNCALTDSAKSSWWSVDLLGNFNIRAISITLGHLSSDLIDIRMESGNGTMTSCAREVNLLKNSTIIHCSGNSVRSVMIHAENRLHLCSIKIYAVNAQSPWQCAVSSMDVLTIHENSCYSVSKMEKLDWKSAQKRCLDSGGTLPLRLDVDTQTALKMALTGSQSSSSFYWIGLMGTNSGWRWADGDPLDHFEDWYEEPGNTKDGETLAAVMGRPAGWKWMTAAQSVWNPWICQTKPKFCTSPGVSANGKVVFSSQSYAIGTYAFYSCEIGFMLIGDQRRRCQIDGRWSSVIPLCQPVDCGAPKDWNYGTIHLVNGSTAFGHQLEYRCRKGTVLEEGMSDIRTCEEDSMWSEDEPVCIKIDCGKPPKIANGDIIFDNTTLNSSVLYFCDDNFRLIGHSKTFCTENGNWYPSPPVCYDVETLKAMNDTGSSDKNIFLCLLIAIILAAIALFGFKAYQRIRDPVVPNFNTWLRRGGVYPSSGGKSPVSDGPRHLVYATPSQQQGSMIYYAPTGISMMDSGLSMTQFEVPPHLVHLQQLPNGNIHVTLPTVRPILRPSLLNATNLIMSQSSSHRPIPPSPTNSQLLYSFDHEPIYDQPPDNIYEELITTRDTQHTVC